MAFTTLGLEEIATREIIRRPQMSNDLLGSSLLLRIIGSFITLLFLIVILYLFENESEIRSLILIISLGLFFNALTVTDYYFKANLLSQYLFYPKIVTVAFISTIKLLLILYNADLVWFAVSLLADYILLGFFSLFTYQLRVKRIKWKIRGSVVKSLFKYSLPLLISGFFVMAYTRMDVIMIKYILGVKDVGVYSAASKISEAWYFIPSAICSVFLPKLMKLKISNQQLFEIKVQQLLDILSIMAIPTAIVISVFAKTIIGLIYGEDFIEASIVLAIHIWGGVFVFLGFGSGQWLLVNNLQKYTLLRSALAVLINLILNIMLIPNYGVVGAAIATLISQSVSSYFSYFISPKTRGLFVMQTKSLWIIGSIRRLILIKNE